MTLKKSAIALSALGLLAVGSSYANIFMAPQISTITGTINNQSTSVFTLSPNDSFVMNANFTTPYPNLLDSNTANTNTWVATQLPMQSGSDMSGQFIYTSTNDIKKCIVTYELSYITGELIVTTTPSSNSTRFGCTASTYRAGPDAAFAVTFTEL